MFPQSEIFDSEILVNYFYSLLFESPIYAKISRKITINQRFSKLHSPSFVSIGGKMVKARVVNVGKK